VADELLEVGADRPELLGADVQRLPGDGGGGRQHDRPDEVLDSEELVAVAPVAEHVDAPAFADPVEEDLEDAEALRPDERLRPEHDDVEAAVGERATERFGVDLRAAVVADSVEGRVLADRVRLRDAVDGGRRDVDGPADAGVECCGEERRRAVDVDRADLGVRAADRQSGGGVHEHICPGDEAARCRRVAHVAAVLIDVRLELGFVERREVERADSVSLGKEPPREMEAEEAGTAGDRPEHGRSRYWLGTGAEQCVLGR
jgi:hypothetical protein